jgi:orotidine-5'-phosphate decarboxylase
VPRTGKDTLIVALDVPNGDTALKIVDVLDNVSFFKLGLQLFIAGEMRRLLDALYQKQLFVDLKVPGDIANTIGSVVNVCVDTNVRFLTLSESMPLPAITSAKIARDKRGSDNPKFLTVPFLSSLDRQDLHAMYGQRDLASYVLNRAKAALEAGSDGVVASGQEIALCRKEFPSAIIVSPGIRPAGASSNDHKRFTTPREAIQLGADYLVVGRPILESSNPRLAAQNIMDEIDQALSEKTPETRSSAVSTDGRFSMSPA